jgi:ABC-type uncharacterized transport system ATPase subunit
MSAAVQMREITKRYGALLANDRVDFTLSSGTVHALVGENGAGKSTLMSILYGLVTPDAGTIEINGERVVLRGPADAIAARIGMVHQHFMIAPSLTVAENIVLGRARTRYGLLDRIACETAVKEVADNHGFKLDPGALARDLPVGVLQRVEIVKALFRGAEILILDEPTAVLTPQETEELARALRALAEGGTSVVLITHKLKEVMGICDVATVLRRGVVIDTVPISDTSERELARMMVGHDISEAWKKAPTTSTSEVLRLSRLSVKDDRGHLAVRELDFTVNSGTIVGIAGVEGNGQTELVETITGLRVAESGQVILVGDDVTRKHPRELRRRGVAHIPEDRVHRGVALGCSVRDNLILNVYKRAPFSRFGLIRGRVSRVYADDLVRRFGIAVSDTEQHVASLSGGNMQKVIVARELAEDPRLVVAAQPTRGVDIGAIEFIHGELVTLRDRGVGVLLISAELDELLALSDVIHVMYEGQIVATFNSAEATEFTLGLAMSGVAASAPDATRGVSAPE